MMRRHRRRWSPVRKSVSIGIETARTWPGLRAWGTAAGFAGSKVFSWGERRYGWLCDQWRPGGGSSEPDCRRWIDTVASDTEVAGILDRLANGLNEGGIGIGILNAYAPGAGVQELTAVCQLAAANDVPTFTHVAYMSRIDPESAAEAYVRLIGYAGATGAHMHICHFNSSSKTDVERCAVLVARAQAQGLPITVEAYPYGTGSTVLAAAFFSDPEFEARNGTGYDSVQRVTDGRRFRDREELLAAQAEEPSTLVLWHVLDIENNTHHRDLLDIAGPCSRGSLRIHRVPLYFPRVQT